MVRTKLEGVGQEYGVDIGAEETTGRLIATACPQRFVL